MTNPPLVSILIPLYNSEKYFPETIESLLAQTYKNIEIIVVDDGSIDKSLEIARKYEQSHKHIKVYVQENNGAQVARNKAFELSSGDYIQYFDADDIMHPDKISSQMKILKQHGFKVDIVATGTSMAFFDSIEKAVFKKRIIHKDYDDKFLFFKESWENLQSVIGQSWIIPRILNEKIGGWDVRLKKNQDGEFFTRVAYNANKIIFVENSIVYYRRGITSSLSSDRSLSAIRSHLDSYRAYVDLVKNDLDKHSLHKAAATLYSVIYTKYFPLDKEIKEEVLRLIKALGYSKPIIRSRKKLSGVIIRLFGIDTGLYLRLKRKKLSIKLKKFLSPTSL